MCIRRLSSRNTFVNTSTPARVHDDMSDTVPADSANDTIHVAGPAAHSDNTKIAHTSAADLEQTHCSTMQVTTVDAEVKTYEGKGKGRMRDVIAEPNTVESGKDAVHVDRHDTVEEYVLGPDDEMKPGEENVPEDDARSHISLSSDDDHKMEVAGIDPMPWRQMAPAQRLGYEEMFSAIISRPLNGSWSYTEEYQLQLDAQMQAYIHDFPLARWVLPADTRKPAFDRMLQRIVWRSEGLKIYGPHGVAAARPMQQAPYGRQTNEQQAQRHQAHPQGIHPGHRSQPMPSGQTLRSQPHEQPVAVPPGMTNGQHMHAPVANGPVSYTHLTLPTKRIV